MRTWWNFIALIAVAVLLPFVLGALPTVELNGKYLGGGAIRQWTINLVINCLPADLQLAIASTFMSGSTFIEYLIYLPFALNFSALLLCAAYLVGTAGIEINNFFVTHSYKSQRQRAKGS